MGVGDVSALPLQIAQRNNGVLAYIHSAKCVVV